MDHGHGQFSYQMDMHIGESVIIDGCVVSLLDIEGGEASLLVERIDDGGDSWDSEFPESLATSFSG